MSLLSYFRGTKQSQPIREKASLGVETLDERVLPSWGSRPPLAISVPWNATPVGLYQGDAAGWGTITSREVDYVRFTPSVSGWHRLTAATPYSNLDTVLGLFNSRGGRVAYHDDISRSNSDSQVTVNLTAGQTYYFGITNYTGTGGGAYQWYVDGPAPSSYYSPNLVASFTSTPPSWATSPLTSLTTAYPSTFWTSQIGALNAPLYQSYEQQAISALNQTAWIDSLGLTPSSTVSSASFFNSFYGGAGLNLGGIPYQNLSANYFRG